MKVDDQLVGIVFIGQPRKGGAYSAEDLDLLWTVSNQGALSLEGARLLAVELERLEQVRRSSELRSEFLVTIAHELKSPMTVIKAALEMLEELAKNRDPDSADTRLILSAGRSARTLEDLMSNLMTFAKARHQTLEIDRRPVDAKELLDKTRVLMQPLAEQKGQDFQMNSPDEPIDVNVDPDHFAHILNNLVSNAIKYTPDGGSIRVGLHMEDSKALLTVSDTGQGMDENDLPWIFEPYRRATGALDSATPGSGIGLAITKALVELHDGTIEVESKVGEGSTFTISIPQEVADESTVY
jgi:signal transduction histidine kinase